MWNTYGQDTRTNNHVEGWHNSFRQSVGKCHPSIFEFITKLKEEQAATDLTRRNALLGAAPPTTKKKYRNREASIKTLKEEFADGTRTLSEYFSAVRRHVHVGNPYEVLNVKRQVIVQTRVAQRIDIKAEMSRVGL